MKSRTMEPKSRRMQSETVLAPTRRHLRSTSIVDANTSHPSTVSTGGHSFASIAVLSPPRSPGVQTKLKVNEPGDLYEQEADRVAEQVMRMPDPRLQRQCACGASSPDGECEECKKNLSGPSSSASGVRRLATAAGPNCAPPSVDAVINSPGQPLDQATREFFEPRFGHDFSRVRIHTDAAAAQSAEDVQARAYTVGSHIAFGSGSQHNLPLLAHELTHVIQQGNQPPNACEIQLKRLPTMLLRSPDVNSPHPDEDECINLTRSPGVTCPQLLECIELLFERLENRAGDLFEHKGGDPGHNLRFHILLAALQQLIITYLAMCNTGDYVWETERVKEIQDHVNQIQPRQQTPEGEKSPLPTGHGIPDWAWKALGATAAALLVACFATGVCEVGAIVAGISTVAAELIIAALEFADVVVVRNPQLVGG